MTRTLSRNLLPVSLALAFALPVAAQEKNAPQMTPEQQAEMEAYIKAGTPGAVHAQLAKTVGTYDLERPQDPDLHPVRLLSRFRARA